MRWFSPLFLLAAIPIACTSSSAPLGSACASAGGTCIPGPKGCAKQAPSSAQDCQTTPPNPGGAFCCLELQDAGSTPQDGGLPACTWPASLDPTDSSTGQCAAYRTFLSCKGSNGGGEGCLSNDPTQCPGPNPVVGVTFSGCEDQCNADEYAVGCGGVGPAGPSAQLPAGCRSLPPNPGGVLFGCCPCGS
jgi:hypothetical protein